MERKHVPTDTRRLTCIYTRSVARRNWHVENLACTWLRGRRQLPIKCVQTNYSRTLDCRGKTEIGLKIGVGMVDAAGARTTEIEYSNCGVPCLIGPSLSSRIANTCCQLRPNPRSNAEKSSSPKCTPYESRPQTERLNCRLDRLPNQLDNHCILGSPWVTSNAGPNIERQ